MRLFVVLGSLNALFSVAAGAFGAHALKARLPADRLAVFEVAARYHMYHALGLLAVAWLAARGAPGASLAGWAMQAGIVVFSGSLYLLAFFSGTRWLGVVTPLGGLCFMVGWAAFAWAAIRMGR